MEIDYSGPLQIVNRELPKLNEAAALGRYNEARLHLATIIQAAGMTLRLLEEVEKRDKHSNSLRWRESVRVENK